MRKRGKVVNSSKWIDQNFSHKQDAWTRCKDTYRKMCLISYHLNLLPPPHCRQNRKLTCLKKNKHSKLAFISSIHCERLIVTALFIRNIKVLLQLLYRAEGWESKRHSNTFPRESQSVITSHFLPDKIANCLWSCSIISTATSGRISCCMISSVKWKEKSSMS